MITKPDVTRPEARSRGVRDLVVGLAGVLAVAGLSWALDNAGVISAQLPIDETTLVTVLTTVATLFGWRSIRSTS